MEQIAAGIVLYQPDLQCLRDNINAIAPQVNYLIVVDNASKNSTNIKDLLKKILINKNYLYLYNDKNVGIAKALNQIVREAEKQGYKWVLTLDQDSVSPDNLINEYRKHLQLDKAGVLAPIIKDRNVDKIEDIVAGVKETKRCITSGSLLNIEAYNQVGGFNEKLYIDYVDFEYNIRIQNIGFKIYSIGSVVLSHQLGESRQVTIAGKQMITTNHGAIRRYYNIRNRVYCAKKYKIHVDRRTTIKHIVKSIVLIVKYEDCKVRKILAIISGVVTGLFMR